MSIPAPAARRSAAPSAAKNKPAAVARAEAIAGSTTCAGRRTPSISQPSFRWRKEFNLAWARVAARPDVAATPSSQLGVGGASLPYRDAGVASTSCDGASQLRARRDRRREESVELRRVFQIHDAVPQFFALLFPDYIAAKRVEFHRDFFLGHWIARIAFRDIDARRMLFAVIRRDRYPTRLKFWKERFELLIRDDFHFVHDRNQRFIEHALLFELQRRHHAINESDSHTVGE